MPNNSEVQLPTLSAIGSQARKSLMSIASSIVRCTADLLSAARALSIHHSLPVICKSHVVSYLLPFVVANVAVVAESDPKVKLILVVELRHSHFLIFLHLMRPPLFTECCTNY